MESNQEQKLAEVNQDAEQPPKPDDQFGQQFDPSNSKFNPESSDTKVADDKKLEITEEKVTGNEPKIKLWHWIAIAIIVIGFGAIGWWYYTKQNSKPVNNPEVSLEIEIPITPDELPPEEPLLIPFDTNNDGLLDDEEIEFFATEAQATLAQLLQPVILCLDEMNELTKPISGELICNNSTISWPDLPTDYTWFDYYESNANEMTWIYSSHSDTFPDIKCDQTGCVVIERYNVGSDSDSDGDGLTDQEEEALGTDLANPDTDNDSYSDWEEITNGYNPLGAGLLVLDEAGRIVANLEELTIPEEPEISPTDENSEPPENEITYSLVTPQDTLDALALAINTNNSELFIKVASPNNPDYDEIISDTESFLSFIQYTFEFKEVSIEIIETTEEEYPDTVTVVMKTFLDGELWQEDTGRLEKIGEEWKILD